MKRIYVMAHVTGEITETRYNELPLKGRKQA